MNDLRNIAVLGATGSIGKSALDVIAAYQDRFRVFALTAGSNVEKLAQLASVWRPYIIGIADESRYNALVGRLKELGINDVSVVAGDEACAAIAAEPQVDTVIQSVVGAAGVRPSFEAAKAGKKLLLANKESVVCGGELLMKTVRENRCELLPVDSEHNAVAQCLASASAEARENAVIWLTCSGGPFRDKPDLDLSTVTPEMALNHPTWSMGAKITIDSATLMNKGLEVIEAHHLFNFPVERIKAVIHPQSVIHSMVQYADGAVLAQLASPDMRLPISWCLGYPERLDGGVKRLNFWDLQDLSFAKPDTDRFPQLAYAYEAVQTGGIAAIVLNAANEIGVEAFLAKRIGFTDIASLCRTMLDTMQGPAPGTLEDILAADAEARVKAREAVKSL